MNSALVHCIACYVTFITCLWFIHQAIQFQHHKHCKSNLLRVVFYGNSSMCTHMQSFLTQIEAACTALVPSVLTGLVQPWFGTVFSSIRELLGLGRAAAAHP